MTPRITNLDDLIRYVGPREDEIIVVTGYDNVGKGTVINALCTGFGDDIPVFRVDYNFWAKQLPTDKRWLIFKAFIDGYNTFKSYIASDIPFIFDRSSLCGAVYNNDPTIAAVYGEMMDGVNSLHILVTCPSKEDYEAMQRVRGSSTVRWSYDEYLVYTERYRCYLNMLGLDWVEYVNSYNPVFGEDMSATCGGCGHFKSPRCTNPHSPMYGDLISPHSPRCSYSDKEEIQDEQLH